MKTKKVKLAQRLPSNLCSQQPREGGEAPAASSLWPPGGWRRLVWPSAASASGVFYFWTQPPEDSRTFSDSPQPPIFQPFNRSTHATGELANCQWVAGETCLPLILTST